MKIVKYTDITAYPLLTRGKVRDIYEIDEDSLLIITTDRMSAFDVVLSEPVPYKGVILNQLTLFWMKMFEEIVPNPVLFDDIKLFPEKLQPWQEELEGRAVMVRKAKPLPVECIVRGYISGSAWENYLKDGEVCGQKLPECLEEAQKLPNPIFTPTTKAPAGAHDENITIYQMAALTGDEIAKQAELLSLDLYGKGSNFAYEKGIIIADTKFEFGIIDGALHLIDEVLTPDSSRFWPLNQYCPGKSQPSFDKQYLRDWLKSQPWNKKAPAPVVPEKIIEETASKYRQAYSLLIGRPVI